jgi:hypothetical protein
MWPGYLENERGAVRLLDRAPGIAAGSLATSNPVIYWLKDGVAQSGRF